MNKNKKLPSINEDVSVDTKQSIQTKAVSFLSGDTLRWMSKHRKKNGTTFNIVAPSRALQIRSIFRGLDFDNSGSISLQELKEAVLFVGNSKTSVIENPEKINKFFESMDTDGDGTVDYNEFLLGMTATQNDSAGNTSSNAKLQQAFCEFANQHRRQLIIEHMNDTKVPDIERYNQLHKIFSIQFTQKEEKLFTVEDEIRKAKEEAEGEIKEMKQIQKRARKAEVMRSRSAALYFSAQKNARDPLSVESTMEKSNINDPLVKCGLRSQLLNRMTKYSLNDAETYIPTSLGFSESSGEMKLRAISEVQLSKTGSSKDLLGGLPPVSIRKAHRMHKQEMVARRGDQEEKER